MKYHIYCDESCHLENDGKAAMVLGALWCPVERRREIRDEIWKIKVANGLQPHVEFKWKKVSPSKVDMFEQLIEYFFAQDALSFRAIVVPDKTKLDHARFDQTHDDWYYKMYFRLLDHILKPKDSYRIFLDIKDTLGYKKVQRLERILKTANLDFGENRIEGIQTVRSDEVTLMQVADVLIGAVSYANRQSQGEEFTSKAKTKLVHLIKERSGYSLTKSTLVQEPKFNVFVWRPEDV